MKPFVLGLTGSVGMGKTTTARMFRDQGVPVWDADETVHRLYAAGGAAVEKIAALCPDAISAGAVDRATLRHAVLADPALLGRIERVVHPLVAADRAAFLAECGARGDRVAVLDIPLLFETGADRGVDAVVVVTAPPDVQRARVLDRPGMTKDAFAAILSRQMPDAEKRSRSDFIIATDTLDSARDGVRRVLAEIGKRQASA